MKTNELETLPEIIHGDLTSISAPKEYPIMPERFNSISKPSYNKINGLCASCKFFPKLYSSICT